MKNFILKMVLSDKKIWEVAGDIALRFHDESDGAFDDLQEKLFNWIKRGLYENNR